MSRNLYRYHSRGKKEHNEAYFYGKFYFEFVNESKVFPDQYRNQNQFHFTVLLLDRTFNGCNSKKGS